MGNNSISWDTSLKNNQQRNNVNYSEGNIGKDANRKGLNSNREDGLLLTVLRR